MTEIDWGSLQKEAKSLVPDGDYNVIITEATATTASTGKPMIKVKMRITDGPHEKKPLWTQFVVSADSAMALRMFFQHMTAFGLNADFFAQNPSMDTVASNLMNRAATVSVGTRTWQGVDRNDVKGVKALQSGGPLAPGVVTAPPTVGGLGATPSTPPTAAPSPLTDGATAPVPPTGVPSAPPTKPF